MATVDEIAALRLLIAEPDNLAPYDDETLNARLTAAASEYALAYEIWTEKAAAAAGLVDVSEGGSSRKMGDVYEQALGMADAMRERANSATVPPDGSGAGIRIKRLTRP